MKFKKNDWLNIKTRDWWYGIDGYKDGIWYHLSDGDNNLLYSSEKERDTKIKQLRKEEREKNRA